MVAPLARLIISVARVGIILVVGEGVSIFYKMLHVVYGYGKAEPAKEYVSHIGDSNDLSGQVEKRPAGIAGINISVCLHL